MGDCLLPDTTQTYTTRPKAENCHFPTALFYEVQDVPDGRKRNLPASPFCQREELPLRGFLTCAKCGKTLTGSASKGRSARYYYYHCKGSCNERFKAPEANEQFYNLLRTVSNQKNCSIPMN
jgi:site-specific DNA recombinase